QYGHVARGNEIRQEKHTRHAPKLAAQETQCEFPVGSRVCRLEFIKLLDRPPRMPAPFASWLIGFHMIAECQEPELATVADSRKTQSSAHLHDTQLLGMLRRREMHRT